jgi:hypothetical protein
VDVCTRGAARRPPTLATPARCDQSSRLRCPQPGQAIADFTADKRGRQKRFFRSCTFQCNVLYRWMNVGYGVGQLQIPPSGTRKYLDTVVMGGRRTLVRVRYRELRSAREHALY